MDQFQVMAGEWTAYICVECDPEYDDDERDDQHGYEQPYMVALPKDTPCLERCPRCSSATGLLVAEDGLTLGNTLAERYQQRQEAKR